MIMIKSGPSVDELPYRYGCACGAVWNASDVLTGKEKLCGPFCKPKLFILEPGELA
jgi:hypothetical protein